MIRNLNILIVDDDPAVTEVLQAYFDAKGYKVTTCSSGWEALERLDGDDFDLVLSDIEMAEGNGFEVVSEARARHPRTGIILMTAYDDKYPLSEALRAGADGYITKPFSLKKLSLIFERAYWSALSRLDWWEQHDDGVLEEF